MSQIEKIQNSYLVRGICAAVQKMAFPTMEDLKKAISIAEKKN